MPLLARPVGASQVAGDAEVNWAAENPLVITSYLGRKPEAVVALQALAELCGIRVVEFTGIGSDFS